MATVTDVVRVLPRAVSISPEAPGGLCFVLLVLSSATDELIANTVGLPQTALRSIQRGLPAPVAPSAVPVELEAASVEPEDQGFDPQARRGVVRVDVSRLDDAMEGLSSLIVTRFRMARSVAKLTEQGVNTRELREIMADNGRQLRDLRAAIVRVRMVPVAELLERVPLLVRGLRRATKPRGSPGAGGRQRGTRQVGLRAAVPRDRALGAERRRSRDRNAGRAGPPW